MSRGIDEEVTNGMGTILRAARNQVEWSIIVAYSQL